MTIVTEIPISNDLKAVFKLRSDVLEEILEEVSILRRLGRSQALVGEWARTTEHILEVVLRSSVVRRSAAIPSSLEEPTDLEDLPARRGVAVALRRTAEGFEDRGGFGLAQLLRRAASELELADRLAAMIPAESPPGGWGTKAERIVS